MNSEDSTGFRGKWQWQRVSGGQWTTTNVDFLTGAIDDMADEYGANKSPMLELSESDISVTVFSLTGKWIKQEDRDEVARYKAASDDEQDRLPGEWGYESNAYWLWLFESVYPSSHLVYVHYGEIEAYGIFCETFKDMLEVVRLVWIGT